MSRKDITDVQVVRAYEQRGEESLYSVLMRATGQPRKVVHAAMERAYDRGLIDYGVSLQTGWVTDKGMDLAMKEGEE